MPAIRHANGIVKMNGIQQQSDDKSALMTATMRIHTDFQVVTYSNGQYEHRLESLPYKQPLHQKHVRISIDGQTFLIAHDDIKREESTLLSLFPGAPNRREPPTIREMLNSLESRVVKVLIEYFTKTAVNTARHTAEGEGYDAVLQFKALKAAEQLEIRGLSQLLSLEIQATQKNGQFSVEYISQMLGMPGVFDSFLRKWSFKVINDEEKDGDRKSVIGMAVAELPEYHKLLSSYSAKALDVGMKLDVTKHLLSTSIPEDMDASNEAWTDLPADDLTDFEAEASLLDDQEDADQGEASQNESDNTLPPTPTPAPKRLKYNPPKLRSAMASAAPEVPAEADPEPAKLAPAKGKPAKGKAVKGKAGKSKAAKGNAGEQKARKKCAASKKRKAASEEPAEPASPPMTRAKEAKKALQAEQGQ